MEQKLVIKLLSEVVLHPRKFDRVVNVPGQFDAAERLLDHWFDLSNDIKREVTKVLIRSGRYYLDSKI